MPSGEKISTMLAFSWNARPIDQSPRASITNETKEKCVGAFPRFHYPTPSKKRRRRGRGRIKRLFCTQLRGASAFPPPPRKGGRDCVSERNARFGRTLGSPGEISRVFSRWCVPKRWAAWIAEFGPMPRRPTCRHWYPREIFRRKYIWIHHAVNTVNTCAGLLSYFRYTLHFFHSILSIICRNSWWSKYCEFLWKISVYWIIIIKYSIILNNKLTIFWVFKM